MNSLEESNKKIDKGDSLNNNRYYYKWERTSTQKVGSVSISGVEMANKEAFIRKMTTLLLPIASVPKFGTALEAMALGHMSKFADFNYGKNGSCKVDMWQGNETQFKYDRLNGNKSPVRKRIKLTSQSFVYDSDGSLVPLTAVSYTLNLK